MSENENENENETGPEKTPRSRISAAEFAEACELYELGKATLGELADKHSVSRQALSRRFKDAGVVKASRAHEVAEATRKAATASAKAAGERYADKRSDWIEDARIQGYQSLKQAQLLARKIVIDGIKAGKSMAALDDDLKAAQRYSKLLVDNIAGTLNLLGADEFIDEDDLPSLSIEDLTEEDILKHHKLIGAIPEDAGIEDVLVDEALDDDALDLSAMGDEI